MTDEQFEQLMRDAEKTYRAPPAPDFDAMWKTVASRVAKETRHASDGRDPARAKRAMWFRIAATLVVGIGLGRASVMLDHRQTPVAAAAAPTVAVARVARDTAMARPYEVETSQYLGQTAALLVSLPSEVKAGRADQHFTTRAGDLLMRTRLLMDSPAARRSRDAQPVRGSRARASAGGPPAKQQQSPGVGSHQPRARAARRHSAAAHGSGRHLCELRRSTMNRTTLVMMLLAAATVAVAQEPPVRPTPPARPGHTGAARRLGADDGGRRCHA